MSHLRIFVVDDDQDFAASLADVLELDGHQVEIAHSGEEAVKAFRKNDYDLTFMDVKLPGRNGVESFLEIRRHKPNARVYMMTGFSVEQLLEEAIAGGAYGVLHKPLDLRRLLDMLKEIKPEGVLIADDDQQFVESIQDLLNDNGYRVFVARDGREAIDRVLDNGIDVLILDLHLPVLNGLEVYMELKHRGRIVPTIIVTAYANEEVEALDELHSLTLTGVLTKPFDPEQLLDAIQSLTAKLHE